jgi:hypothetical protein
MAITFGTTRMCSESLDFLSENLLYGLERQDQWQPYSEIVNSEEFRTEHDSRVWQVWGFTSAYNSSALPPRPAFRQFLLKIVELQAKKCRIHILAVSLYVPADSGGEQATEAERQDLERIAEKLLEFCLIPDTVWTNEPPPTDLLGKLFGREKPKRKIGD